MSELLADSRSSGAVRTAAGEATRASIMEVAERLFRTMGYQKTTVADIARELRMSPANIYRFFPSKAAINEAICARMLSALDARVWEVVRGPGSAGERLSALFALMQQQTMALFFDERRMHDMVAAALDEHWGVVQAHIDHMEAAIEHLLRDGQSRGEFAPLDPTPTAMMLHATMACFTHPTLVEQCGDDKEKLELLARGMAGLVLRALRPGDEPPPGADDQPEAARP